MRSISKSPKALLLFAMLAGAAPASLAAQEQVAPEPEESVTIQGQALPPLEQMPEGPEVEGMISARQGDQIQVTTAEGTPAVVAVTDATEIRSSGGFLGLSRTKRGTWAYYRIVPGSLDTVSALLVGV